MKKFNFIIALLTGTSLFAETNTFFGMVMNSKGEAITGAVVHWLNTAVGATTDADGNFAIAVPPSAGQLVVSSIEYQSDTILIDDWDTPRMITLKDVVQTLHSVEVHGRSTTFTSRTATIQTQQVNKTELYKAACCNLSESFETNASIDVSYSDAATGAKQIRMLGLTGAYVQMLTENTPNIRGLAAGYGMEYIPGAWMESIQISKGTASVINGFEATTGQINVEYLKPKKADPVALNGTFFSSLRSELNVVSGLRVNDKVSTAIFAHAKSDMMEMDYNADGFIDIPVGSVYNLMNKWDFSSGKWEGHFSVRGLYDNRHGGQMTALDLSDPYRINITTKRVDAFMKNGFMFNAENGTSLGIIASGSQHQQNGLYGRRLYQGTQTNGYLNTVFQTYFSEKHRFVAGASLNFDRYVESFRPDEIEVKSFDREELTPGLFVEYAYTVGEKLSLLAGLRADHSSRYGLFFTPRVNARYAPWSWWTIRASAGLGYRSPNVLSDNSFLFPSSRIPVFATSFEQERALNSGVSTQFFIPINNRELQISVEYYYTHFMQAVIADLDSDPHRIIFDNLNNGVSYARSAQIEANMEILNGWTATLACRLTDVRRTTGGQLRENPLTGRFKALLSTSYLTRLKKWQFDFTTQLNGGGRMPDSDTANPLWEKRYKPYAILMAQITKNFRTWSVYLGSENLTNFTQKQPVIDAVRPFGNDFDASMAWGPIHGAKVYIGFRWALERKE
ncbi:MAG: TonB-dependent receptor [Prevotellaceae bacterium]|nr:TonB-dependent receptor [Prevotellaceae bacterium]